MINMIRKEVNPQNKWVVVNFHKKLGRYLEPFVKMAKSEEIKDMSTLKLKNEFLLYVHKETNGELSEIVLTDLKRHGNIHIYFYHNYVEFVEGRNEKIKYDIEEFEKGKIKFDPRILNFDGTQVQSVSVFDMKIYNYNVSYTLFQMWQSGKVYKTEFESKFKYIINDFFSPSDSKSGRQKSMGLGICRRALEKVWYSLNMSGNFKI